ncbi:gag/polymerase/env polyprotein [Stemphylium lycopersici]|nr:gag/polymerase/env polyprotein [Stemphylium lycopersici]
MELRAAHMHHDNAAATGTTIPSQDRTGNNDNGATYSTTYRPSPEAEDRGEPKERLAKLRERVATTNLLLTARAAVRETTGKPSSTTDRASKLLRALNAATPRPKLGDTGKPATP